MLILFCILFSSYAFSDEQIYPEIKICGTWGTVDVCSYCIENNDYSIMVQNSHHEKYFRDDGLIIRIYDDNASSEFGIIGISPWRIKEVLKYKSNRVALVCSRISYLYDPIIEDVSEILSDEVEVINIEVIDNDEIIFGDFSYPKKTHFYRISGPARIPIKNAVLNDSDVCLRVKPNLNCDVWTKLQKGTKVKIKDKSKESFEIAGESWYWYRVDAENLPDGWVYGKYLDIEE